MWPTDAKSIFNDLLPWRQNALGTTLPMPDFPDFFIIKQQQYCNTVRPQLDSDRFTHGQHMHDVTNMADQNAVFKLIIRI